MAEGVILREDLQLAYPLPHRVSCGFSVISHFLLSALPMMSQISYLSLNFLRDLFVILLTLFIPSESSQGCQYAHECRTIDWNREIQPSVLPSQQLTVTNISSVRGQAYTTPHLLYHKIWLVCTHECNSHIKSKRQHFTVCFPSLCAITPHLSRGYAIGNPQSYFIALSVGEAPFQLCSVAFGCLLPAALLRNQLRKIISKPEVVR